MNSEILREMRQKKVALTLRVKSLCRKSTCRFQWGILLLSPVRQPDDTGFLEGLTPSARRHLPPRPACRLQLSGAIDTIPTNLPVSAIQEGDLTMLRSLVICLLSLTAVSATGLAGDRFYFPDYVFAPPQVYYAAPIVSYQPAYAVPMPALSYQTYGVPSVPVSTVSYSTQYYAPLVPTISPAPWVAMPRVATYGYYAPRTTVIAPAIYSAPAYYGYRGHRYHGRRYRGVEIEIERDGDIEIDYR